MIALQSVNFEPKVSWKNDKEIEILYYYLLLQIVCVIIIYIHIKIL